MKKQEREAQILAAAARLFSERRFDEVLMDDIAREAGVAKGTVYQYFHNKADLLVHAGALEKQRYMAHMREIFTGDYTHEEKLRRSLRGYFMAVHDLPLSGRMMAGDREMAGVLQDMGFPDPQAAMEMQAAGLRFQMRRAAPGRFDKEELKVRSRVLIGLIQASTFVGDERIRGGLTVEQFAGTLADMLMDGIVGGGEPCS